MSSTTTTTTSPKFASKEAFFSRGLVPTILDATQSRSDCAICLEPMFVPDCSADSMHDHSLCLASSPSSSSSSTSSSPEPDSQSGSPEDDKYAPPSVKIAACGHVFGYGCILTWCEEKNTCPMCRCVLWEEVLLEVAYERWFASLSDEEMQRLRASEAQDDGLMAVLEDPAVVHVRVRRDGWW